MSTSELSGLWRYRSFNPTFVTGGIQVAPGNPQVFGMEYDELELILADGFVFKFQTPTSTTLEGTFESRDGGVPLLDLRGTVRPGAEDEPVSFDIVGTGRTDAGTDGWEYRYHGHLTPRWRKPRDASGVDQRPTLVGSVIRAKPHGESRAGLVYSFIAVKGEPQPDWTLGLSGLWTYRSFHNNPTWFWEYKPAPQNVNELILQEAVLKLETPTSTTLQGTIEGHLGVLDLQGTVRPGVGGEPSSFQVTGIGRPGPTLPSGEYYYQGHLTRHWPKPPDADKVEQRPALVGSVIWAKPQVFPGGSVGAPAGYVAPFIAVKTFAESELWSH